MRRLVGLVLGGAAIGAVLAAPAAAALFFLFQPASVTAGDRATVRLGGTPPDYTAARRVKPFQRPIRLYLARAVDAGDVRGRFDPRLHFIGRITPDANSRGLLRFTVPPLDTGDYVVAAWCPGCARYSRGRTFFVQTVPRVSRYREQMGLRIELPDPRARCPASVPNAAVAPPGLERAPEWHTNGFLWTRLPVEGVLSGSVQPDGSIFTKPIWLAAGVSGELRVRYQRIDAAGPLLSAETVRGAAGGYRGPAWAARIVFPSEGCWRVTGRVADVALSYVVRVVASQRGG